MEKQLKVEIVSPDNIVLQSEAESVTAPGIKGEFQVLYNHAAMVSILSIGKIKVNFSGNDSKIYSTSGGILEVTSNKVSILAETIEESGSIDVERAKLSFHRAEERIRDAKMDKERAFISMERAKNRLRVSGNYK